MKLLQFLVPKRVLRIQSSLSPAEIYERLRPDVTERERPVMGYRSRGVSTPYSGQLTPNGFLITRVVSHQNSFLPMVHGRLEPVAGGTVVHVEMQPLPFVAGFMLLWLAFVTLLTIVAIAMWSPIAFGGPVMFAFGLGLSHLAFGSEAHKAETYLRERLRR